MINKQFSQGGGVCDCLHITDDEKDALLSETNSKISKFYGKTLFHLMSY